MGELEPSDVHSKLLRTAKSRHYRPNPSWCKSIQSCSKILQLRTWPNAPSPAHVNLGSVTFDGSMADHSQVPT